MRRPETPARSTPRARCSCSTRAPRRAATPENENQIGRFPDEASLNDVAAKIADPNVSARNAVPGGALVATLRIGTPVTQVAKHETFILCTFADPKNAVRTLEGWVAEQAFIPGPTVPSKAACGPGQTRLVVDEQDFCGKVCKSDGDCQSGQVCIGKASLFVNGKVGAEVATCTLPAAGVPREPRAAGRADRRQGRPGVQIQPRGEPVPPGLVLGPDKLCHRDCTQGRVPPRPGRRKCAMRSRRDLRSARRSPRFCTFAVAPARRYARRMAKPSTQFVCQACGAMFPKWVGRCTTCAAWNTLVEEVVRKSAGAARRPRRARTSAAIPVGEVAADHAARVPTGIGELDRVLGGGAVLGGVTLLGGDPGVGKSTLLLQALACLAAKGCRSLYVSGEESAAQTAARARRVARGGSEGGGAADQLLVLAENDLDAIERVVAEVKPTALVLDSVQTVRSASLESAAGTVSQLREVTARMVERAKRDGFATFLVGHVTKDGALAGPKVLEHLVDTVLAFEGERSHSFRSLRTQKNRFGSATEVGVFEMTAEGMREVKQPSALFLAERPKGVAGSVIAATSEGSRSMLVEVQALVGPFSVGSARRTANGVDGARLAMILAVLERKAGLQLAGADVFVNVAGGVRVDEPAIDLPMALAIASSLRERPVPPEVVAFGEIGLAGEVRSVPRAAARLAESAAMGFPRAIVPASAAERAERLRARRRPRKLELVPVRTIEEALAAVL